MTEIEALPRRELFFGLVVPLGVEKETVSKVLRRSLKHAQYDLKPVKISKWLQKYAKENNDIDNVPELERKELLMNVGDDLRRRWDEYRGGNDHRGEAAALIAIARIWEWRAKLNKQRGIIPGDGQPIEQYALESVAYLIDSIKHPDELDALRRVYGPAFISIGVYAPPDSRRAALELDTDDEDDSAQIDRLMDRDSAGVKLGQRVGEAFFNTDFIIDASQDPTQLRAELDRLVELLFGNVYLTPRPDEYGMFLAKAAQVRSGSLARQIGAAIMRDDGSVIACGTNEVAKPLIGGQYWPEDDKQYAGRDMLYDPEDHDDPRDSSDWFRGRMLDDVLTLLGDAGMLVDDIAKLSHEDRLKQLYYAKDGALKRALIKDNIDYIRAVHAEAAAIIDAGRHGVALLGTTLHSTTFPCHECARHIVAAGIKEVVYLEPYPKSGTKRLYRDSIAIDPSSPDNKRVTFRTFRGVAPPRYLEFFTLGQRERKDDDGRPVKFEIEKRAPSLPYYTPTARIVSQSESTWIGIFTEFTGIIAAEGGLNGRSQAAPDHRDGATSDQDGATVHAREATTPPRAATTNS